MASWKKSIKEFEVETLLGPFPPEELPSDVRLAAFELMLILNLMLRRFPRLLIPQGLRLKNC